MNNFIYININQQLIFNNFLLKFFFIKNLFRDFLIYIFYNKNKKLYYKYKLIDIKI